MFPASSLPGHGPWYLLGQDPALAIAGLWLCPHISGFLNAAHSFVNASVIQFPFHDIFELASASSWDLDSLRVSAYCY